MKKQPVNTAVIEHYKSQVLHAVKAFFDENSLGQYAESIQQLSYYVLTPGEAKNLPPEKLLDLQHTAIELVSGLAKIYESYHSYTTCKQEN